MLKIYRLFLGIILMLLASNSKAQLSSRNYSISNNLTGSLADDMNGNSISFASSVNQLANWGTNLITSTPVQIGFPFNFMGKMYTHVILSSNGVMGLALAGSTSSILTFSAANDLTRATAYPPTTNNCAVIAPFWDKMYTAYTGVTVRGELVGTAPNRCFVIEWNCSINSFNYTGAPSAKFQARLYENTGVVEYVYGNMSVVSNSSTVTASLGWSAGNTDSSFVALKNLTSLDASNFTTLAVSEPATQSLVNASAAQTISALDGGPDGSRKSIRFTPPALQGTAPDNFRVTDSGATYVRLAWNDHYSNELGYWILSSTDGFIYNPGIFVPANSTSAELTNLIGNTRYYLRLIAVTDGASSTPLTTSATTSCSMSGTYHIGTGSDFPSLTEATRQLKLRGVTGNITLQIDPSYQAVNETFPITFPKYKAIGCATNSFRLSVYPAAGTSSINLTGSSDNSILKLDSCSYLTLDGRPGGTGTQSVWTIYNQKEAPAVHLLNAGFNTFRYLNMGGGVSTSGGSNSLFYLQSTVENGSDSNRIENCQFFSDGYGIDYRRVAVLSSVSNPASMANRGNKLLNCSFRDFAQYAVYLMDGNDYWIINGCSFYQTAPIIRMWADAAYVKSVYSSQATSPILVQNSFFGGSAPQASGTPANINYGSSFHGIYVEGNAEISGNTFRRMKFSNDSMAYDASVQLIKINNSGNSGNWVISNNQIGGSDPADSISLTQNFYAYNAYFSGIACQSGYGENQLLNNRIQNLQAYSATDGSVILNGITTSNAYAKIRFNNIGDRMNNHTGANTIGIWGIASSGSITNNQVHHINSGAGWGNNDHFGIWLTGSLDSIAYNEVYQLKSNVDPGSPGGLLYGIFATSTGGGAANLLYKNKVYALENGYAENGGTVEGIRIGSNMTISSNLIHSLNSKSSLSTNIVGISIPDKESSVDNNMIRLGLDSLGHSISSGNLMFIGLSGGNMTLHNTVYIGGTQTTDGFLGSIAFAFLGNAMPTYYLNNIFVNKRSNSDAAFQAKHQAASIHLSYLGNYNILYSPGTGGIIGTYGLNPYTTLDEWRTGSGLDANSLNQDPRFLAADTSGSLLNLHLSVGTPAEAAGTSTYTTNQDFDGETRSALTPVDIGADAALFNNCPPANAGPDIAVISGTVLRLGSTGINPGVLYHWSDGAGFESDEPRPVITATNNRQYTLTVRTGNCLQQDVMNLSVFNIPTPKACPNGTVQLPALVFDTSYQWQVNTGNGYQNISDNSNYSGTHSNQLTIQQIPSAWYGYQYRCISETLTGGGATLIIENNWTGTANSNWENPLNWSCGVLPDGGTDVQIPAGAVVVINGAAICRTLNAAAGAQVTIATGGSMTITH